MRIYDISLFVFIFVTILGTFNAMEAARTGWYIFGAPAGVSVNATTVNATDIVGQVMPSNTTMSYYEALTESWLGIPIRAVNALWGFFRVALFMGHYLQELIPFIPTELAWAIDIMVGIPWAVGAIQLLTGRYIER